MTGRSRKSPAPRSWPVSSWGLPPFSADETADRWDAGAVGKHGCGERALFDPQMIPEQALEHGAQIGGRFEVASLMELGLLQSRPVGDDAPAAQCATDEKGNGAGAMVGAVGAVDARGAPELGDDGDHAADKAR